MLPLVISQYKTTTLYFYTLLILSDPTLFSQSQTVKRTQAENLRQNIFQVSKLWAKFNRKERGAKHTKQNEL